MLLVIIGKFFVSNKHRHSHLEDTYIYFKVKLRNIKY